MDPESHVQSSVLLLVAAAAAVALFRHFGLGSILGLLVAGILIGPHTPGPSVTGHVDDLRHFTELGVVLLLFVIGLELHPRRLWELRRTLFGLGSLQILGSGLVLALYFWLFVGRLPIDPRMHFLGSAVTALCPPMDNLAAMAILDYVKKGDVSSASGEEASIRRPDRARRPRLGPPAIEGKGLRDRSAQKSRAVSFLR